MPKLKEFYEKYADLRGRFEILAFHENFSKITLKDLDEKMSPFEKDVWGGKLPFPILLDKERVTIDLYGVNAYPTLVLIDPDGKVVRGGSLELLKEKLGIKDK